LTAGAVTNSAGQSIVYVLGGYVSPPGGGSVPNQASSILAYNASTNAWTTKKAQFIRSFSNGVGEIGGKLYIPGGYDFSEGDGFCCTSFRSTLWVYDPALDRMTRKADMPKRTAEGVSGVIAGKLYVLPGECGDCVGSFPVRFDRYDPATNRWAAMARVPHNHSGGVAGVIDDKFYVAGGRGGRFLDVYDPATNSWKTLAPLPVDRFRAVAAVLNGKLYVAGVQGFDRRTFAYNPATNRWSLKAQYPAGQYEPSAAVQVKLGGAPHLWAVGGSKVSEPVNTPAPSQLYTP
jgi:N-acetylneuraminic acid mutarotase